MKGNWKIILIGSILLALVGFLLAVKVLPFQAQPKFPLNVLLLRPEDICDRVTECMAVISRPEGYGEIAKEVAEFIGLSMDYCEGAGFHVAVYVKYLELPHVVKQAIYRYKGEKEAAAHYEQLLKGLPRAPLGRETPIISTSERSFNGVRGQVIEAQDPEGTAYWFIGTRGGLLTILYVLSEGSEGQPVLEQLMPLAVERMVLSR